MIAADGSRAASGLAPYASDWTASRGRLHAEPESATRTPFQRDRDRIIHSTAFRRLKHKTQVFVYHEGDHYRTRLTHSLEVAQIARSLARALMLDEDLAEALALGHDLGHPPFGHAGEEALDEAMAPHGGFDHNGQTLRVMTRLEARYAAFDGLNPTWETLEGVAKHNGPLIASAGDEAGLPWAVAEVARAQDLELHTWPGPEAQVAALADDIAYHAHDLDDGLRAGLFAAADVSGVPLAGPAIREVDAAWPGLEASRLAHETVRRMIDAMVADVLAETRTRLDEAAPRSAEEVRRLAHPVVAFSAPMERDSRDLKSFLFERMYRHFKVNRMTSKARRVVGDLFALLLAEPECLPSEWRDRAETAGQATESARLVCDYVAGMTDRYALDEHRRLFDLYDEAR
ncbi:MAG: deoxyguanosinetriphosphate triphosphohydrolase [Rhodospirillales bacterium]|nr:deoxyguanosinetriphosphate triphosphohydrolase [Rhodospirillales bacterium]